jgi:hypothetical protein
MWKQSYHEDGGCQTGFVPSNKVAIVVLLRMGKIHGGSP